MAKDMQHYIVNIFLVIAMVGVVCAGGANYEDTGGDGREGWQRDSLFIFVGIIFAYFVAGSCSNSADTEVKAKGPGKSKGRRRGRRKAIYTNFEHRNLAEQVMAKVCGNLWHRARRVSQGNSVKTEVKAEASEDWIESTRKGGARKWRVGGGVGVVGVALRGP